MYGKITITGRLYWEISGMGRENPGGVRDLLFWIFFGGLQACLKHAGVLRSRTGPNVKARFRCYRLGQIGRNMANPINFRSSGQQFLRLFPKPDSISGNHGGYIVSMPKIDIDRPKQS